MWRTATAIPAVLATVLAAAGCAVWEDSGDVIDTLGTNTEVDSILLRNVRVVRPADGSYREGDDARVYLTLFNEANHPDRLLRVTTTHAEDVTQHWDQECDGTAERVDSIPLLPEGGVPAPDRVSVVGQLPYHLELTGITTTIRAGTTIPLTFSFAGTEPGGIQTTIDAMVQSHPHPSVDGLRACVPEPALSVQGTEEPR